MDEQNIKKIKRQIIEISYSRGLSHIGSCLTAAPIIYEIYKQRKKDEIFVLSSGHAGLALYCILEHFEGYNAQMLFDLHGVHPNRDIKHGIFCSSGSLGNGFPIALGMALADRSKNVYCLTSDGEWSEGSMHEALRIKLQMKIRNLHVYINQNGWGAYGRSFVPDLNYLGFTKVLTNSDQLPFLKGLDAHYHVMTEDEYKEAMEILQ